MTLTREEETKLIEAALAGSETAFAAIFEAFESLVRHAVFGVVPEDDVEDIVQETFLRVYRNLGSFQGDARLGTWIHRIAFNQALTQLRALPSQHAKVTESLDETYQSDKGESYLVIEPGYDDRAAEINALRDLISRASLTLDEKDRRMVALMLEGYGPTEVAEITGGSVSAAKSDMYRVRQRMKDALTTLEQQAVRRVHTSMPPAAEAHSATLEAAIA